MQQPVLWRQRGRPWQHDRLMPAELVEVLGLAQVLVWLPVARAQPSRLSRRQRLLQAMAMATTVAMAMAMVSTATAVTVTIVSRQRAVAVQLPVTPTRAEMQPSHLMHRLHRLHHLHHLLLKQRRQSMHRLDRLHLRKQQRQSMHLPASHPHHCLNLPMEHPAHRNQGRSSKQGVVAAKRSLRSLHPHSQPVELLLLLLRHRARHNQWQLVAQAVVQVQVRVWRLAWQWTRKIGTVTGRLGRHA